MLSLLLVAAVFGLAPQEWSFLETLLAAAVLMVIYEMTLAIRDR